MQDLVFGSIHQGVILVHLFEPQPHLHEEVPRRVPRKRALEEKTKRPMNVLAPGAVGDVEVPPRFLGGTVSITK